MGKTKKKPYGYWNVKERCLEDAKKYKTRSEWGIKSIGSYKSALKHGWVEECSLHMNRVGSTYKRLIYSYIFPDDYVYIGLTYNEKKRYDDHLNFQTKKYISPVYRHMIKTNQIPKYEKLTDYIQKEEACKLEDYFIEKYRNDGYNILNKKKGGALGGSIRKYTKEYCLEDGKKYNTIKEWVEKSRYCYESARRNGWMPECCSHMIKKIKKPRNYWTKERCLEDAKKYKTQSEWRVNSLVAYNNASKNGWLRICFPPKKAWYL